jgi:hypothetical protein
MACANAVGLLSAFVEWASSSPPTDGNSGCGGGGGGGTMTRSAATHLVGAGRDRSTTSPACTGLPGWWHRLHIPATRKTMNATAAGWSGVEEGQGAAGPEICAAGVPAAEMTSGVDPGTSVLEGLEESNVLANWVMDTAAWWVGALVLRQWRQRTSLAPSPAVGAAAAATPIARAPTPALARVAGITGKGWDGKAVMLLSLSLLVGVLN